MKMIIGIVIICVSSVVYAGFNTGVSIKMIYGIDNRQSVTHYANPTFRNFSKSIAGMIDQDYIIQSDDIIQLFGTSLGQTFRLCREEKFYSEPSFFTCTGFLVNENTLLTAGHCIQKNTCQRNKWIFDVTDSYGIVSANKIYGCAEVLYNGLNDVDKLDIAIIRLDRPVLDRKPLQLRKYGNPHIGDELVIIGHPSGAPMKIADHGNIRSLTDDIYLTADLDSFHGNSGSPVFNKETGLVEGILVRGDIDYLFDYNRKCNISFSCPEGSCRGEDVTRITTVKSLLENII